MRRLWAHIIIAFTCLVTAFAVFPNLLKGISTNGDYRDRHVFTYQLSQKEAIDDAETPELTENSAKEMAAIMESRLLRAGVSSYEITTSGNDIVTVAFDADNSEQYTQLTTYLSFSGSFALVNTNPDGEPLLAKDFLDGSAYLKANSVNEEPTIIIPVNTDSEAYKSMIEWTRQNPTTTDSTDEDGEATSETHYYVYLIYNYVPGDTYKALNDDNKLSEKVLLTFDVLENDDMGFYYDLGDGKKAYSYVCHFSDSNSNEKLDANEVEAAYDQAHFIENLFSAEALDYDVKLIKGTAEETLVVKGAAVENLFSFGKMKWTATLIASIAAFVIVSLLLVVFYRLGAVSVITTTIVNIFLSFLFMIKAGLEFNSLAVVGFILVATVSLVSGIIYNTKLKDEAYKGRSLKKANAEASRKSTLPIIDVHIVALVIGLMVYLLGGQALHTLSSVFVLGTLVSFIVSTLGLKAMMWLSTNTTGLTGKYNLFAIDEKKVPNHMAEEKQSYFGAYADKDLTKNKKPVSIIGLVAFVAAFAGIIASGLVNKGPIFTPAKTKVTSSEIYLVNTIKKLSDDDKSPATRTVVDNFLDNMMTYDEKDNVPTYEEKGDNHLANLVKEVNEFTITEDKYDEGTKISYLHTYFEIKLKSHVDGDAVYLKDKEGKIPDNTTINEAFETYFEDIVEFTPLFTGSIKNSLDLKATSTYTNEPVVDWSKPVLATFIATLIITVYLMLRYRLSRGLATLIYPVVNATITLGIFVLLSVTGLALPSTILGIVPAVALLSYVFMILIMNKERDMIADERVRDNTVEHRQELLKKSLGMIFTSVLAVSVIGAYLFINFFGFGPAATSYIYLAGIFGLLIALGLIAVTYVPLANLFYKWFSGINLAPRRSKKKSNKVVVKKNSAEPEEAIFIGIND